MLYYFPVCIIAEIFYLEKYLCDILAGGWLYLAFNTLLVITWLKFRITWGMMKGRFVKGKENRDVWLCRCRWMNVYMLSLLNVCVFLSIYLLFVCMLLYPLVCLPAPMSACLLFSHTQSICQSICLSGSFPLSSSLSVYPSVCLSSLRPWSCLLSQVYEMRAA